MIHFSPVILRNCLPGSKEYDNSALVRHFADMEEKDNIKDIDKKYCGLPFMAFEIEKEGNITKDNFFTEFVPEYMVESRKKHIDAIREGLTLNGKSHHCLHIHEKRLAIVSNLSLFCE